MADLYEDTEDREAQVALGTEVIMDSHDSQGAWRIGRRR